MHDLLFKITVLTSAKCFIVGTKVVVRKQIDHKGAVFEINILKSLT